MFFNIFLCTNILALKSYKFEAYIHNRTVNFIKWKCFFLPF